MALVKFGGGITAMSGSIAGNTFARNATSYYVRARTKPVNPNTTYQVAMRTYVKYLTQRWRDTLTPTQRLTWQAYANGVSMKNKLGEVIHLSGFNMYIRYNSVRLQAQNSKADSCLGPPALIEGDPTFAVAASVVAGKLSITWDDTLPWGDIAASIECIWQGTPQNATRNYFSGPWRYAGSWPGNSVTKPYLMDPAFPLVAGQKIWIYGRIATGPLDGRLSEPMIASCTITA
jgi:hypothetical protein